MIKVESVPWIYAPLLDNSKEAYFISYRELGGRKIQDMAEEMGATAVMHDKPLRGYYIFVKHEELE
jgi:hypothetical protein